MKLRDEYDWIVLSDHPGALLSGVLAAKLGLAVLILPLSEADPLKRDAARALVDPEPNWWTGLAGPNGEPGLLARCLERAGKEFSFIESPDLQCLLPGYRVEMGRAIEDFERAALRENPQEREAIQSLARLIAGVGPEVRGFWASLPERRTKKLEDEAKEPRLKRALKRWAAQKNPNLWWAAKRAIQEKNLQKRDRRWLLPRRPESAFLQLFLEGVQGASFHRSPLQGMAVAQSGGWYRGGAQKLRQDLIQAAMSLGATYDAALPCRAIFIEEGRFLGVQVSNRGSMITGKALAVGCGIDQAREYISTGAKKSWRRRLKRAPEATSWCFTLSLSVREGGVPAGMGPHLVWQDPGAPPLLIENVDPADYGLEGKGRRLLFLRTYLPFEHETLGVEYQRKVAARMLRQFVEIAPFVEYHLLRVYPDFRGDGSELSEVYGFPSLSLVPESLRRYRGTGVGVDSGVQGIYMVNGEAFPELGTLGSTVAAVEALARVAHAQGKAGPFSG